MKKNLGMLALIMAFWFTISFITNILGPLIPDIIHNFNLSDLAMAGFITPWMAGIGMSGSSLLVVLNSLRLQKEGKV